MTTDLHPLAPAPAAARPRRRVPAFVPVPLRSRADGWTPPKQALFLGALAETGSVSHAAARVRMSRESAYRLRRKPGAESFAVAWDYVTGALTDLPKRKITSDELWQRVREGLLRPVMHQGKCVGVARKADNTALLKLLGRLDRAAAHSLPPDGVTPEGHGANTRG